jgi:ABC-type glycerol-3-phosphate transport system permease component
MRGRTIAKYAGLAILAGLWLVPLYITVVTAIRNPAELATLPAWSIPRRLAIASTLQTVLSSTGLAHGLENSILYSLTASSLAILIASSAAYALAKLPFRGSKILFVLLLTQIFLPAQVFYIPQFYIFLRLGLFNTQAGMIIIYTVYNVAFATFLIRNYLVTIPKEISEAAKIDGGSNLYVFSRVIMPLAKPALAVVFIFLFANIWNDFAWAQAMTSLPNAEPVMPLLLVGTFSTGTEILWNAQMMGALIAMAPTTLVFVFFQRYFVTGLSVVGRSVGRSVGDGLIFHESSLYIITRGSANRHGLCDVFPAGLQQGQRKA